MKIKPTLFLRFFFLLTICYFPFLSNGQGLRNSHHDFVNASWSGGESCRPCHTPHNADQTVPDSPLWNHQVTAATFQVYSSSTMNSFPGQPTGYSKLCLSCHDGTVAIENHGTYTSGTTYATFGNLTTNLQDDHPVSFTYNSALASVDPGLHDPHTTLSGLGGTIEEDLLQNGVLQCTSCHDVHLGRNVSGCSSCHTSGPGGMVTKSVSLWKTNDGSALCLTCHNK